MPWPRLQSCGSCREVLEQDRPGISDLPLLTWMGNPRQNETAGNSCGKSWNETAHGIQDDVKWITNNQSINHEESVQVVGSCELVEFCRTWHVVHTSSNFKLPWLSGVSESEKSQGSPWLAHCGSMMLHSSQFWKATHCVNPHVNTIAWSKDARVCYIKLEFRIYSCQLIVT